MHVRALTVVAVLCASSLLAGCSDSAKTVSAIGPVKAPPKNETQKPTEKTGSFRLLGAWVEPVAIINTGPNYWEFEVPRDQSKLEVHANWTCKVASSCSLTIFLEGPDGSQLSANGPSPLTITA